MNKKLISLAIAGAVATPFAGQAGTLNVANQDITLSGGITGAYFYTTENTDPTVGSKQDAFAVPDALIDISSAAKPGGMGFTLGIGTLGENSLASGGSAINAIGSSGSVGVQYGWVTVMPMDGLKVDAGILATNVGYEVSPTYSNPNILLGLLWSAQPTYYTGARATYTWNNMSFYAEANKGADPNTGKPGGAIGASGNFAGTDVAFNYIMVASNNNFGSINTPATSFGGSAVVPVDRIAAGSLIDVIVKHKIGSIDLAADLNYLMKSDREKKLEKASFSPASAGDDNAIGIAFYASMPVMDKVTVPVRVEYVSDGTSGLYGLTMYDNNATSGNGLVKNNAITFTVTPTYHFSDSTFVRAELAYVSADKKSFLDDKGKATDSNMVLGVQGGVLF